MAQKLFCGDFLRSASDGLERTPSLSKEIWTPLLLVEAGNAFFQLPLKFNVINCILSVYSAYVEKHLPNFKVK